MPKHTIATIYGLRLRNEGRGVGVEIEVEGSRLLSEEALRNTAWKGVADGSLRGESIEYVLKGPLDIAEAKKALVDLETKLKANRAIIKPAHRGSVHIHVNMQSKTYEQVFTTLYLWMLVEPLWLRQCGPQRDGNLFCLPSYLSGDLVFFADEILAAVRTNQYYTIPQRGKYAAVNTDCLTNFGSLEFRTFPSTTNAETISQWVDWCDRLCKLGSEIDIADLIKVSRNAKTNPRVFFERIFGKNLKVSDDELASILDVGIDSATGMMISGYKHVEAMKNATTTSV